MSHLRLARATLSLRHSLLRRTFLTTRPLFTDSPTVLSTFQPELKLAMRAKDKPRLTVLRALLAEITNASKTPKPVSNDAALFSLLSKQIKASQGALQEFEAAKREDLVEKERGQLSILEGYLAQIETVKEVEIRAMAEEAVGGMQGAKAGQVMGKVMGKISGRPVDSDVVKKIVEEVVAQKA
ncbi:altered inheritance of mitochondria protein 41, mitochondrial [Bimuria novae-zelandiae CBS 107.79]|uniref:Altered inheritance of mitochondria protein 41 n=1 Tax=Bimuria novae-zelandiae CBS 107.79 TaxID=1447943 RepID=A0A6A5VR21_9PLEO|nr:altered inheritance of mitochondria protein 41, mitochondrial [Bimuria novae-zelandiae CBS 107.79]